MRQALQITDKERIVYSLNVEDLQDVADEELSRELTAEEIQFVEDKIGDYISWYEAVSFAIRQLPKKVSTKKRSKADPKK